MSEAEEEEALRRCVSRELDRDVPANVMTYLDELVQALADGEEKMREEVAKRTSHYAVHYWGSGRMISLIGYGLAKSMVELVAETGGEARGPGRPGF